MEGSGAKAELIAKITEIKASPQVGQKRLVIAEQGRKNNHAVIDITTSEAKKLEEKQTYRFQVEEKHANRAGQSTMRNTSGFKTYACEDEPETFDGSTTDFNRFGGGGGGKGHKRTKF